MYCMWGRTVVSVFLVYYRWVYVLNVSICTECGRVYCVGGWVYCMWGRTVVSVFLVCYRWVYVLNVAVCTVWVVGCTVSGGVLW